jgi:hypothetical protein
MWVRSAARVSPDALAQWTDEGEIRHSVISGAFEQFYEHHLDLHSVFGVRTFGWDARGFQMSYITEVIPLPNGIAIALRLPALHCTGEILFDKQLNPWLARIGETNRPVFAMDARPRGRSVDYLPWRGTVEVTIAQADRTLHGWTYYRNDETTALGHTGIQGTL